jgi:hypothetical protein
MKSYIGPQNGNELSSSILSGYFGNFTKELLELRSTVINSASKNEKKSGSLNQVVKT